MTSVLSRSIASALACALLAGLPLAAPAAPSAAIMPVEWNLSPQQIRSSCATKVAALRQRVDAIVRTRSARTFATVVLPLENASADLNDDLAAQAF
ncbi:MAG TPA: hypothetical protein VE591_00690, partial [Candidatus Acidoferrum sp.]|nr:hypothetical protein [Candidatus Acidoferrum sp.]